MVEAYEGAEAFLHLVNEADEDGDRALSSAELERFFRRQAVEEREELDEAFADMDRNEDGSLSPTELPEEARPLVERADLDGDGLLDYEELAGAPVDDPRVFLELEMEAFLAELDEDGDGIVDLSDLPPWDRIGLAELDRDEDGFLTRAELLVLLEEELRGAVFEVEGDHAVMHGTIGPSTPGRVLELILEHPDVDTIVLVDVPGSMDDDANLRAARCVRRHGFTTVLPERAEVASGGTDFFLAGRERIIESPVRLGVHSWAGFDEEGADLPRDHPEHRKYIDYYREMGIAEEFYWFTLEAAPADDIHWMTDEELRRFGMATGEDAGGEDSSAGRETAYGLDAIDVSEAPRGIVPLPEDVAPEIRAVFGRYARVVAPSGRPIHILAQDGWSEDQIVRARKVLEHLLADVPGSRCGADKRAVADAMAERRATLVLFDDVQALERAFSGYLGWLELGMQDLRANECPVEGTADYLAHDTRDAAFEEILHLVHDYGIRPALPDYDAELQRGSDRATAAGLWDPWPEDEPDSWRNEYIAAIYDNYLDLWTVPPRRYEGEPLPVDAIPEGTSHFGTYRAGSRARLAELDPVGYELVEAFLPPGLTYEAELPEDFAGIFTLTHDPALRYTTKSRHLRHVRLRGAASSGLVGDDVLDGGAGTDTAVFRGKLAEYRVEEEKDGGWRVVDLEPDRDGEDVLRSIEHLRFADGER